MNTPRYQRGVMALMMAILLIGLLSILSLITVAQYYWAKRDAQKVADMAALSGVQHIDNGCSDVLSAASVMAKPNWGSTSSNKFIVPTCGNWNPAANASPTYFKDLPASASTTDGLNAVQVVASVTPTTIIPESIAGKAFQVNARAIATKTKPMATFSVGTTLLSTTYGSTLGRLLGEIGIPIDKDGGTSLVSYNGLANARITPSGLLKELGIPVQADATVGGLESTLDTKTVSVGDLLNAAAKAAGQDQLLDANADLLSSVESKLHLTSLPDITLGGPDGLLASLAAPAQAAQSAAIVQVDAMQAIISTLWLATRDHALQVKPNINLGALTIASTTKVIEPPTIASGGPGTTAYTAQTRMFLQIGLDTSKVPVLGPLLSDVVGTNIKLNLPVVIDLVGAQATLQPKPCGQTDAQGRRLATFQVNSAILKMCVGDVTAANAFSKVRSCDQLPGADQDVNILKLQLAGSNLLSLTTHFHTEALTADGTDSLYIGQTKAIPENGTPLNIGTSVDNLFTALTRALVTKTALASNDTDGNDAQNLANKLWNATNTSDSNSDRLNAALDKLQADSTGLQGLLAAPPDQLADILGNTLDLDVPGLLGGVGGFLNGVTDTLTGLLGNLTGALGICLPGSTHSACMCINNYDNGDCVTAIKQAIDNATNTSNFSNSFISKLGLLTSLLKDPLDQFGENTLTPLIKDQLGLKLGQTDVHLINLQCHGAQLVY